MDPRKKPEIDSYHGWLNALPFAFARAGKSFTGLEYATQSARPVLLRTCPSPKAEPRARRARGSDFGEGQVAVIMVRNGERDVCTGLRLRSGRA